MRALALLIGNANYPASNKLYNAAKDARDFGNALDKLGFVTQIIQDGTIASMDAAVDTFCNNLDKYDIGLFFYSGHGFQEAGENYLTAIDTTFTSLQAKRTSLDLRSILNHMKRAENATNIIILDACREELVMNPKYRDIVTSSLAPVFAPKGTIIAFSTSPGESAIDGFDTDANGIYTRALLAHIMTKGLSIEDFFKRVRNSVFAFSNERQTSWEHTSLTGEFIFNSGLLVQSGSNIYGHSSMADVHFDLTDGNKANLIIKDLKSSNWYIQNPAMEKVSALKINETDQNHLFVLGRNILQAAEGNTGEAVRFMEQLHRRLLQFNTDTGNALLDGMLFEVYFNSEGNLREHKKSTFLGELLTLKNLPEYEKSFQFIETQLKPFEERLFYLPTGRNSTASIDVLFELQTIHMPYESESSFNRYLVQTISFEGKVIMRDEQADNTTIDSKWIHHEEITFVRFKAKMADLLAIPPTKLIVNTNIVLNDNSPVSFLYGAKIRRI